MQNLSRRQFVKFVFGLGATIGLLKTKTAFADDKTLPMAKPSDEPAKAFQYCENAKVACTSTMAKAGDCGSCQQYKSVDGKTGTCLLIPGKRVTKAGVCNMWMKKA
jgi:hypothetical protein